MFIPLPGIEELAMQTTEQGTEKLPGLTTLPGDVIRRIMWGVDERFDIERIVQSARSVARGHG